MEGSIGKGNEEKMSWAAFEESMKLLSEKIDFRPDAIVSVLRGGSVPGRILCTLLGVNQMYGLTVEKIGETRRVTAEIKDNLSGKNVLADEDMLETGNSLEVVVNYLLEKGAIVKTACIFTTPETRLRPDYYIRAVSETPNFPWE